MAQHTYHMMYGTSFDDIVLIGHTWLLQGYLRHALSIPLGPDGVSHAPLVRCLSPTGGCCICGQHVDGNCGQLHLRAKLLVP